MHRPRFNQQVVVVVTRFGSCTVSRELSLRSTATHFGRRSRFPSFPSFPKGHSYCEHTRASLIHISSQERRLDETGSANRSQAATIPTTKTNFCSRRESDDDEPVKYRPRKECTMATRRVAICSRGTRAEVATVCSTAKQNTERYEMATMIIVLQLISGTSCRMEIVVDVVVTMAKSHERRETKNSGSHSVAKRHSGPLVARVNSGCLLSDDTNLIPFMSRER